MDNALLVDARKIARDVGHDCVNEGHILCALAGATGNPASAALSKLGYCDYTLSLGLRALSGLNISKPSEQCGALEPKLRFHLESLGKEITPQQLLRGILQMESPLLKALFEGMGRQFENSRRQIIAQLGAQQD